MNTLSKFQALCLSLQKDNNAVNMSVEIVFFLVLTLVVVAALFVVVNTYIIGDGNTHTGFIGALVSVLEGTFGF